MRGDQGPASRALVVPSIIIAEILDQEFRP